MKGGKDDDVINQEEKFAVCVSEFLFSLFR